MKLVLLLISLTIEFSILTRMVWNGEIFPLGQQIFFGAHLLTSIMVLVYVKYYEKNAEGNVSLLKSFRLVRTLIGIQIFFNSMGFMASLNPFSTDEYIIGQYLLTVRALYTSDGARLFSGMISTTVYNIFIIIALLSSFRLWYKLKSGKISEEGSLATSQTGGGDGEFDTSNKVNVFQKFFNLMLRLTHANQLGKGIQRLIIVGWIFLPILFSFMLGDYGEEIFTIWLILLGSYWVLVAIGMWVYKGFVVEKQNHS